MCKPSPPSQPWAQRRLAPYFRQATVALHPAHPHNLGLPMGLSECHLVFCTMGLPESKPPLATLGLFVGGICHGSVVLPSWIGPRSSHRRNLESIHMYSSRAHAHGFLLVLSFGQPAFATLNFLVSLVKDAWPLAPWVMALNPAHPGNLGSLGAPFLQLHVARLCPLEPTLATLPPHDAGHNFFLQLGIPSPSQPSDATFCIRSHCTSS